MSKERRPLGIRPRSQKVVETPKKEIEKALPKEVKSEAKKPVSKSPKTIKKQGRPNTKEGKKLMKYSMDIHPGLKRAVVKAAAIYDKEVHVMWNEIVYDWFVKESKKNPGWYSTIDVKKSEL